jgi:negative regulator of sigma E activity
MNHDELCERLSAYLEADLEASERARIEEHLRECPACRREYRELRHTVDLLRGLPAPDPPLDLADRVIARLRAGEGRTGLVARCQARVARIAETPWSTPVAAVAVALGVLGILRGVDVSLEFPGWDRPESRPQLEIAEETPPQQPPARPVRATRRMGASAEPSPVDAVSPMLDCVRAGGPSRSAAGPSDPCEHWDSWMVGLGMRDAPAFVVELEALPAPERARVLVRLRDFATRSGSAPMLASTLRSARDPRAARLASRIERTSAVSTR